MKRKLTVLVMAVALLCTLLSGCKSMPDELRDAIGVFNVDMYWFVLSGVKKES